VRDLLTGCGLMTCYYNSQTTIWHTMSSLLNHLRLPSARRTQLWTNCSLWTPELDWLFSTELFFITTSHGPNRKYRF
jgi:hypothetical protein